MFTIIHQSGLYFHNKGRIILFESQDEAQNFMSMFVQYSIGQLMQDGRIHEIMQAQVIPTQCKISKVDFDVEKVKCGTVLARELFEEIERK